MTLGQANAGRDCSARLLARRARRSAAPATAPRRRAPARRRQPQGEPRPAIWLLADEDTSIYLFGTVHVLHPGPALALGRA